MTRKSRKRNRNASALELQETASIDVEVIGELPECKSTNFVLCEPHATDIGSDPIVEAIAANTVLIQKLLDQVSSQSDATFSSETVSSETVTPSDSEIVQLRDQIEELTHRNHEQQRELQRRQTHIDELSDQTEELASQLAQSDIRQTLASNQSSSNDALSWDDRKKLILAQLEADTFDADKFVSSIGDEFNAAKHQSPKAMVEDLILQLQRSEAELAERKIEIGELQMLLDQQSETHEGGIAIGAAAIAQLVDGDELVIQERERLQALQDQWEEKFRHSEIEASLERAKLSRERQELAKKTAELDEELQHLRREAKQEIDVAESGTSRRWLAKLGLSDAD